MGNIAQNLLKNIKILFVLSVFFGCSGRQTSDQGPIQAQGDIDGQRHSGTDGTRAPGNSPSKGLAHLAKNPRGKLALPSGKMFDTYLALTTDEQTRGLSGVRPEDFADHEALLFFYRHYSQKSFWMPDTYFDLHIVFLDENLKIIDIEKNVPYHPGRQEPPPIAVTRSIYAKHVLEVKSSSPLAQELQQGLTLKWISPTSLLQIESGIPHRQ